MGSVSPPLPFEKHAACGAPRRVPSIPPHDGVDPIKKIRRKFQTPPGFIKAETQQAPEVVVPSSLSDFLD